MDYGDGCRWMRKSGSPDKRDPPGGDESAVHENHELEEAEEALSSSCVLLLSQGGRETTFIYSTQTILSL